MVVLTFYEVVTNKKDFSATGDSTSYEVLRLAL